MCLYLPTTPAITPPAMGTSQDQAIRTKRLRQNQALLQQFIDLYGTIKNKIVVEVQPVLLSPIIDPLTRFGQVASLYMLQHLFSSYR